jgi:hypothetical protein
MPAAQVINLNAPEGNPSPMERTAESFSQRYMENRDKQRESDALKAIYGKYQGEAQMIQKRAQDINSDPNISPSMKVQSVNQMVQFEKYNQEIQKRVRDEMDKENEINAVEDYRGLDRGTLKGFKGKANLAATITKPANEPRKTQASQPIDAGQLDILKRVRETDEFKKASLSGKHQILTSNNVSKENSDAEVKYYAEEEKLNAKNKKNEMDYNYKVHKDSEEYDAGIVKEKKAAEHQLNALKDVSKAIENVKPASLANIFRTIGGEAGKKVSDALLSKDQAKIQASIPSFLEGRKELFGVRLSDADLALLSDKLPDMGKSKEANKAIIKIMEKYSKSSLMKYKIAKEIKAKNEGLRGIDYINQVEDRFEEMMTPVRVINPDTGREISIPAYELGAALEAGASLVND